MYISCFFSQYTDLSRVDKVVGIVADIKSTISEFETKTALFNKREALFGIEVRKHEQALVSL